MADEAAVRREEPVATTITTPPPLRSPDVRRTPDIMKTVQVAHLRLRVLRSSLATLREQVGAIRDDTTSVAKKLMQEADDTIRGKYRVFPIHAFYRHLSDKQQAQLKRPGTQATDARHLFKNFDHNKFLNDDANLDMAKPPPELIEFLQYQLLENAALKEKAGAHRWQMMTLEGKLGAATQQGTESSEHWKRSLETIKSYEEMLSEMRQRCHTAEMENLTLRSAVQEISQENLQQRNQFNLEMETLRTELSAAASPKRRVSVASVFSAVIGRRKSSATFTGLDVTDPGFVEEYRRRRSTINAEDIDDTTGVSGLAGLPRFLRSQIAVATQTDADMWVLSPGTGALKQEERSKSFGRQASVSLGGGGGSRSGSLFGGSGKALRTDGDPLLATEQPASAAGTLEAPRSGTATPADNAAMDRDAAKAQRLADALAMGTGGNDSFFVETFATPAAGGTAVVALRPDSAPTVVDRLYKLHDNWATKLQEKSNSIRREENGTFEKLDRGKGEPSSHHLMEVSAMCPPLNVEHLHWISAGGNVGANQSPSRRNLSSPPRKEPPLHSHVLLLPPATASARPSSGNVSLHAFTSPRASKSGAAAAADFASPAATAGEHSRHNGLLSSPRPPAASRPGTGGPRNAVPAMTLPAVSPSAATAAAGGGGTTSPERLRLHNAAVNYQRHFIIAPAYEPALKMGVVSTWASSSKLRSGDAATTSPKRR